MSDIKIKYNNNIYTYPKDITLLEISKQFAKDYKYEIIIALVDNNLTELNQKIKKDCVIDFYDISHLLGNRVYERGLVFLYIKAVKDVLKKDVIIEHSIDRGIYTEIINVDELTDEDVNKIESRMKELVSLKMPFERLSIARNEMIDYYNMQGMIDKAKGLKYLSNTFVTLYRLDNLYEYFYGEMPIDTSYLIYFELTKVTSNGIVLRFPNIYLDSTIVPYKHREKLFEEFKKYHQWLELINLNNLSDLNQIISDNEVKDIIYMCEIEQNGRLIDIARTIYNKPETKIILIAGPSSSGKTTTSKKLSLYLRSMGLKPHSISIDDYFLNREDTPKKEDGKYDYESVEALNIKLFNDHLQKLLNNEEVLLPEYNFVTGESEYKNKRLKLEDKDILIIEGLHALNESLTETIDGDEKYKIYVSPLTSINLDNHNRISTSDNRLLRRMIRDVEHRGYKAKATLERWQDVRKGEEKYVFPYQDTADVVFNTSLVYELGVLRVYAEPLLFSIKKDDPYYDEAIRLLNILRNILPITSNTIPLDSIIREFIGDSYFIE